MQNGDASQTLQCFYSRKKDLPFLLLFAYSETKKKQRLSLLLRLKTDLGYLKTEKPAQEQRHPFSDYIIHRIVIMLHKGFKQSKYCINYYKLNLLTWYQVFLANLFVSRTLQYSMQNLGSLSKFISTRRYPRLGLQPRRMEQLLVLQH